MQKHKIKFKEIPQFTRSANYRVNSRWDHCMETLEEWQTGRLAPLNLDPDFQRAHVWSREQQIRYVEYKLRGGYGADQIAVFEAKLKEVENWAIRLRDLCDKNHLDYVAGPDDLALLLAIVYADGKFLNYLTKG